MGRRRAPALCSLHQRHRRHHHSPLEGESKKSSRRRRLIRWGDGAPPPLSPHRQHHSPLEGESKKSSRRRRLIRWGDGAPPPLSPHRQHHSPLEGESKKSSRRRRLIRWGDGAPPPYVPSTSAAGGLRPSVIPPLPAYRRTQHQTVLTHRLRLMPALNTHRKPLAQPVTSAHPEGLRPGLPQTKTRIRRQ